jgi:pimeloyl-ACP methyl ester carboxylesterase
VSTVFEWTLSGLIVFARKLMHWKMHIRLPAPKDPVFHQRINPIWSLVLVVFSMASAIWADSPCKIFLQPKEFIERAELYALEVKENPKAVLVLCPGYNGNGEGLIKQKAWQTFALEHQLGLIGLSFASKKEDLQNGRGYYYAEQGSGELLLKGIDEAFGEKKLPILLYGFSGGAHFTSRFMEWKPERVKAWCAYSAAWWDEPRLNKIMPPGIVACGDYDGDRHGASQMFFAKGRALGKPWTWVSLAKRGHEGAPNLDKFVRLYFATILKSSQPKGGWRDIDSKKEMNLSEVKAHPTLAAWLPDSETLEFWQSLHQP